jgi:fumarate hydratase subunit beta
MVEYRLNTPIQEEDVRKIRARDIVYVSGTIFAARDQAHRRILEYTKKKMKLPVDMEGAVIFHCGPIIKKTAGKWEIVTAGPTTSSRMNDLTVKMLENFMVRLIIGKGGMDSAVAAALKRHGAFYCHFTGGAGVLAAKNIKKIDGLEWSDLGLPEALWKLRVENFGPCAVTIDAYGGNLHREVESQVKENVKKIYQQLE